MAKFCSECGTQIPGDTGCCPKCTTVKEQAPVPNAELQSRQSPQQEQAQATAPPPVPPLQPTLYPAVGTGTYFGLMLLFALPVVGFILCIVMCFAPKNKSLKSFAGATLIWMVIGLVLTGLTVALFSLLAGSVTSFFENITEEVSVPLQEMFGSLGELQELTDAMGELSGSVTETTPIE